MSVWLFWWRTVKMTSSTQNCSLVRWWFLSGPLFPLASQCQGLWDRDVRCLRGDFSMFSIFYLVPC